MRIRKALAATAMAAAAVLALGACAGGDAETSPAPGADTGSEAVTFEAGGGQLVGERRRRLVVVATAGVRRSCRRLRGAVRAAGVRSAAG